MKIIKSIIVILLIIIASFSTISLSHGGRTDSNGGHYDHSTGEYHYHHGYSAHLHPNGICPYNPSDNNNNCTKNELKQLLENSISNTTNELQNNIKTPSSSYSNLYTGKIKPLKTNTSYNNISNTSNNPYSYIKEYSVLLCIIFFVIIGIIEKIYDEIILKNKNKSKNTNTIVSENKSQNNIILESNNKIKHKNNLTTNYYKCPRCNGLLKIKYGKYGGFIGCSNYPQCKYTKSFNKRK